MQLSTSNPSMITAQAPHSPSPHPSLVPVRLRSSRNTSSRRFIGAADNVWFLPLTTNETCIMCTHFRNSGQTQRTDKARVSPQFDVSHDSFRKKRHFVDEPAA